MNGVRAPSTGSYPKVVVDLIPLLPGMLVWKKQHLRRQLQINLEVDIAQAMPAQVLLRKRNRSRHVGTRDAGSNESEEFAVQRHGNETPVRPARLHGNRGTPAHLH